MKRLYITRYITVYDEFGPIISNPLLEYLNAIQNNGVGVNIEATVYTAPANLVTGLPITPIVAVFLEGDNLESININGVECIPPASENALISDFPVELQGKVAQAVLDIDSSVNPASFTTVGEVINFLLRSTNYHYEYFGGKYRDGGN